MNVIPATPGAKDSVAVSGGHRALSVLFIPFRELTPESAHGDQRVADLRLTQDQQLAQLRSELAEARQDARGQHR